MLLILVKSSVNSSGIWLIFGDIIKAIVYVTQSGHYYLITFSTAVLLPVVTSDSITKHFFYVEIKRVSTSACLQCTRNWLHGHLLLFYSVFYASC